MTRESLQVGYCLLFSTSVPSNIWLYTLSLYILSFSIVKVNKFWFLSTRGGDLWHQYTRAHQHSHPDILNNTRSHINNTKYKKKKYLYTQNNWIEKNYIQIIHPNLHFFVQSCGEAKLLKRTLMALTAETGFVLVSSSRFVWFPTSPE